MNEGIKRDEYFDKYISLFQALSKIKGEVLKENHDPDDLLMNIYVIASQAIDKAERES